MEETPGIRSVRRIPLRDYQGYSVNQRGDVINTSGQAIAITNIKYISRVSLFNGANQRKNFPLWFLRYISQREEIEWDLRGYKLFKRTFGMKPHCEGDTPLTVEVEPWREISVFDVLDEEIEYQWWKEHTGNMDIADTKKFNEMMVARITADTHHLSTDEKIKRFYGRLFKRRMSEVEIVIEKAQKFQKCVN